MSIGYEIHFKRYDNGLTAKSRAVVVMAHHAEAWMSW